MASLSAERLYRLLPAIYRVRDAEQGEPLRALLAAFAVELSALEENTAALYDDQFIETCAEWVAPYIGDLIGYRPLHGVAPQISSPRAEVARTIAFRRRKGTALMLEELAQAVTDFPSHAVEFFERLATTQYMKHVRLHAPATADLRNVEATFRIGSAFDRVAHTVEVRRPENGGRHNIPNVGIFLWRLRALRLSAVPLTPHAGDASGRKFRVNPLGADLQLFRRARTESDISELATPLHVPDPLDVRLMALAVRAAQASPAPDTSDDDYGPDESVVLLRPGAAPTPVPVSDVRICDLRDIVDAGGTVIGWNHETSVPAGSIGLDPERGRVLLGSTADGPLLATFHYAQVRAIGGGEYERSPAGEGLAERHVAGGAALQPELDAVAAGGRLAIDDSLTYAQTPEFKADAVLAPGARGIEVVVAAGASVRPLIAASGEVRLSIGARGKLVLDGLVISGGALRLPAAADSETRELVLRDCTLVPGRALLPDGTPATPGVVSLLIEHPFTKLRLERCITGPLRVVRGAEVELESTILDANSPENAAYAGDDAGAPGGQLSVVDCTCIGKLHTELLRLASDSIFFARLGSAPGESWRAPLIAERRQEGCVRFSYLPLDAIAPRRFRCAPSAEHPNAFPHFGSLRFGTPAYCQLRRATDASIREGASDGSEMGVLRPLAQPQRETNLRLRLDEYLRLGLSAGIYYVT